MNKKQDELIELLTNEDFKKWTLEPTYERDLFWQKWLENNPEQEVVVNAAKEFIKSTRFKTYSLKAGDKDEILSNIISKSPPKSKSLLFDINYKRNRSFISAAFYKVAAVILIIAAFSGIVLWSTSNKGFEEEVAVTFIKKENLNGRKSTFMLPDGTKVILNSASTLTYASDYGDQDRTVRIKGEAFFDVKRDVHKPFNVISGNIITTALGTSFNVRAFESEDIFKIALKTGKIKVASMESKGSEEEHLLNPGEGYKIEKAGGKMEKITVDPLMEFGWKDGILTFKDNNLQEVVELLERWYGVNIKVNGKPDKEWQVDGNFQNETLEQILQGLSFTYELEFLIDGKNVELKF